MAALEPVETMAYRKARELTKRLARLAKDLTADERAELLEGLRISLS